MGIAAGDRRHDRGIGDRQPGDSVHSQFRADHCAVIHTHPCGGYRVKDGGRNIARRLQQRGLAIDRGAGFDLDGLEFGHAFRGHQCTRMADRIDRDPLIGRGREIIGPDRRWLARICRGHMHRSTAFGAQVAYRYGQRRKAVQGLAKGIKRQGLNMILDIGCFMFGCGAGENPELRRGHRQGTRAFQRIVEPDLQLSQGAGIPIIQRARARDAENRADLEVIGKVLADALRVLHHVDAQGLENIGASDSR